MNESWYSICYSRYTAIEQLIGFSFKERFLRFQLLFLDFYYFHHVIWRTKWAKKLETKNGQNMSSGPFSHDAVHLTLRRSKNTKQTMANICISVSRAIGFSDTHFCL